MSIGRDASLSEQMCFTYSITAIIRQKSLSFQCRCIQWSANELLRTVLVGIIAPYVLQLLLFGLSSPWALWIPNIHITFVRPYETPLYYLTKLLKIVKLSLKLLGNISEKKIKRTESTLCVGGATRRVKGLGESLSYIG